MKTGKFWPWGSQEQKQVFFGPKGKKHYLWWDTPTCTSNLINMSAGKCIGTKSLNRIELSWFVQVLLHFSDLRSPGSCRCGLGVCGCECGCVSVCPPYALTCMHIHTCICMCIMLKYTCIEIANGHLHGGINVYHVYNMHVCVCMCVCMLTCVGVESSHPHLPPTHPPPRRDP